MRIAKVQVNLVSTPVKGGFADATRKVENVGYTIVRLTTDDGVEGFGITYHEVGGEATKVLIDNDMAPRLIGRDPFDTEVIWQEYFHYLRGVGRKGLTFAAMSAIDIALWDLKGKILNLPLYKLFGGGPTDVPVYASGGWTSHSDDALVEEMLSMADEGYTMLKFKVGVDGGENPRKDIERVRKVREAVGPAVRLAIDANNAWDAGTAIQFANNIRQFDIAWFEEPVFADDIPGLARFRQSTDIPLATGEHEYTKFGARDLILSSAVDIVQFDIARAGGFTEMLKISAITQAWNLKFAPHAMENIHIHLVSASPNGSTLERLRLFEGITAETFTNAPLPHDGVMTLSDRPGLGLELNLDFIERAVQG